MSTRDEHSLGYHDVDGAHNAPTLVDTMRATARWPSIRQLREWEMRHLGLSAGERLLDVGCGRGEAAAALAQDLGGSGELVVVDASVAMVDEAREELRDAPCTVRFTVGDARFLAEPDGSFDAVRSERTLQWVPGPDDVVAELVRVVRPTGRLSLIDTDWSSLRLQVGNPEITEIVRAAFAVERHRPSSVGGRLGELMTRAGCRLVAETTQTHVWTEWDPDDSGAPDGCFSMTSLADDLVDIGHLDRAEAAEFVEEIHRAARDRRFEMSLDMYAAIAVRT